MANNITITTLAGSATSDFVSILININSDGSEESFTPIFINSSFINNSALGRIYKVQATGSDCLISLNWSQNSSITVLSFNPAYGIDLDFGYCGGLKNPNGAGATGNITMNTANLDSGDMVTILLTIYQK